MNTICPLDLFASARRAVRRQALLVSLFLPLSSCCLPLLQAARGGGEYLKLDVGGKGVGLAGAQFASEGDIFGQYYNPALLSGMVQREFGVMHNEHVEDMRQEVLTYGHPLAKYGYLGFGLNYFTYGKIAGYDDKGLPTGDVSADDMLLGGAWSRRWEWGVLGEISSGLGVKVLRRKLAGESGMGVGLDLGAVYPVRWDLLRGMKIGAAVQNLGMGAKIGSSQTPLPQTLRIGAVYGFWGDALKLMADGIASGSNGMDGQFGAEYRLLKYISVRLGYKWNQKLDKKVTFGIGFGNPIIGVDYGFVPLGELGDSHRVSAVYRFGKKYKELRLARELSDKVREARRLKGEGDLVGAYLASLQVKGVAPWLEENNLLMEGIAREFREIEERARQEKLGREVETIFVRGEKFYSEGNLINARLEFQAILGLDPENKAAKEYLTNIEGQFKSFVESFYRAGMEAFAKEDYGPAKEEFEKVLVIDPNHEGAKSQLARCMEILERREKEVEEAQKKESLEKNYQDGLNAYKRGEYEEALVALGEAVELNPTHGEARRYLKLVKETLYRQRLEKGGAYASRGQWEEAVKQLRKAVDVGEDVREAREMLADAQRRWGLQKKVLSQGLYKEGLEAFLGGQVKKAKDLWQRAIEMDPDNEEAKRGLSRVSQ